MYDIGNINYICNELIFSSKPFNLHKIQIGVGTVVISRRIPHGSNDTTKVTKTSNYIF